MTPQQLKSLELNHRNFEEQVFEISFGDGAIHNEYTEKEVLNKLREFSDRALLAGELVEAMQGLKRYLQSVEHLLPETQDREEVINYMEQVLEQAKEI